MGMRTSQLPRVFHGLFLPICWDLDTVSGIDHNFEGAMAGHTSIEQWCLSVIGLPEVLSLV